MDPLVADTDQPYAFTGDDPLNLTDPLGMMVNGGPGEMIGGNSAASAAAANTLDYNDWLSGTEDNDVAYQAHNQGGPLESIEHVADIARHAVAGTVDGYLEFLAIVAGHHEVAGCLGAGGGFGAGGAATGCVGFTGDGTGFASATAGGGGYSPGGAADLSIQVSNAQAPADLRGLFGYQGGSADLGLSVGGGGFEGNGSNNRGIVGGEIDLGLGIDVPLPAEFHGGISNTWITGGG